MIALTSKGQGLSPYTQLSKGEASPYDSAVVIKLSTYRSETEWMKKARTLIDSLTVEINILDSQIELNERLGHIDQELIQIQTRAVHRKEELLMEYDLQYTKLHGHVDEVMKEVRSVKLWNKVILGVAVLILIFK